MNVVINETVSVSDDVVQFVSKSLLVVYNFTNHNVYDCCFVIELDEKGLYRNIYKAEVESETINITELPRYNLTREAAQLGFNITRGNIILNFTLFTETVELYRKQILKDVWIPGYTGNYRISWIVGDSVSTKLKEFIEQELLKDNSNIKLKTHNDDLYCTYEKTVETEGFVFNVYRYNDVKNKIRLKIHSYGQASIIIGKSNGNISKNVNVPDSHILELNNIGISKTAVYKQNPTSFQRLDKMTIGF